MTDIDWSKPLEAVHDDGRVVPAQIDGKRSPDADGDYWLILPGHRFYCAGTDDDRISPIHEGWRIRNTPQQTLTPDVVGEAGKQAIELLQKMLKWDGSFALTNDRDAARAIVALLPEPVDGDGPDIAEARELGARFCDVMKLPGLAQGYRDGGFDNEAMALRSFLLDLGMPK